MFFLCKICDFNCCVDVGLCVMCNKVCKVV